MDTPPLLTTVGAAIATILLPLLTSQVKRLPWPWLAGQGVVINAVLSVLAFALGWLVDGATTAQAGQYLWTALIVAGLGSAGHSVLVNGPEKRSLVAGVRRRRTAALVALLAVGLATAGCSSAPVRMVRAVEIGADLHRETMIAAGAASVPVLAADGSVARPPLIDQVELEQIRDVGRKTELTLRGAQAAVDLYLAALQLKAGGGAAAAGAVAAAAELQAALMDLVRVAIQIGLEVHRAGG
jgi:hypothetical protein